MTIPPSILSKITEEADGFANRIERQMDYDPITGKIIYNAFLAGAKMGWKVAKEEMGERRCDGCSRCRVVDLTVECIRNKHYLERVDADYNCKYWEPKA